MVSDVIQLHISIELGNELEIRMSYIFLTTTSFQRVAVGQTFLYFPQCSAKGLNLNIIALIM